MRQFKVTERKTDRSSVLDKYLSEISKIPILSPEEESELAKKARNGDSAAKEKLIKSNLRFVISVAKSYSGNKIPLMDLISQGNIGLIESAETFDPSMGFKFISYAIWRIRKHMLDYISNLSRTIRVPGNVLNGMAEIKRINHEYNQKYEREATVLEIKERFEEIRDKKWISQKIENIMDGVAADSYNIPLELRHGEEEDQVKAPISWLQSEDPTEETFREKEVDDIVDLLLDVLDLREKKVVMDRMGKHWGIKRSFEEIGKQFGKSPEWAIRVHDKAMKKLKIRGRRLRSSEKFEI